MFDFTSSKFLILGIVALLVIGPKDLPALLRTIGKYVGIIKRQAAEFRAQFDEAMRESELAELKQSVESIQQETETAMRDAQSSVERQLADASLSVDEAMADPHSASNAEAVAAIAPDSSGELNGSSHPAETSTAAAREEGDAGPPAAAGAPEPAGQASEKSGA
jgi:sec-independent protein translocase protein TatB